MTGRTVARSAAGMGAVAAVSRGFGAVRVLVVAAILGTTFLGNTFQGSNQFTTVIFELLAAGALSAVLVPTFVEHLDRHDQAGAERLAGGVLGVAVVALGAVAVVGVVFAPALASLLASGVDDPETAASQEALATYLLRFFIPQLVLYAFGAIATAVLHARRVFALPAAAPIANTIVMIALLLVFRAVAGPDPGLDLSPGQRLLLAAAGTLGVAAFVAVPVVAVWRSGFRLVPRFAWGDAGVRRLAGLGGWATLQHGSAALLLGAAIIVGGGVEGGVVAFQIGWFLFLAPYGIVAQPIQTAVLPELVDDLDSDDPDEANAAFAGSVRWALDTSLVLLLPITAGFVALALPIADALAFGGARSGDGVELIGAAIAGLGVGVVVYGCFLLLARAWYALGDSRTPALASLVSSVIGVVAMFVVGRQESAVSTVLVLGLAHSGAFLLGAGALYIGLRRRVARPMYPPAFPAALALSVLVGGLAWLVFDRLGPEGRWASAGLALVVVIALGGAYLVVVRRLGLLRGRPGDVDALVSA